MHNYYLLYVIYSKNISESLYLKFYIQLLEFFLYMIIVIIIERVNIEYVTVFCYEFSKNYNLFICLWKIILRLLMQCQH